MVGLGRFAPLDGVVEVVLTEDVVELEPLVRHAALLLVGHLLGSAQIVAGREVALGAVYHDDPDVRIVHRAVQGRVELVQQAPALGVSCSAADSA